LGELSSDYARLLAMCYHMFVALTKDKAVRIMADNIGREMEPEIMSTFANTKLEAMEQPTLATATKEANKKWKTMEGTLKASNNTIDITEIDETGLITTNQKIYHSPLPSLYKEPEVKEIY
jgi:hypothetical protein